MQLVFHGYIYITEWTFCLRTYIYRNKCQLLKRILYDGFILKLVVKKKDIKIINKIYKNLLISCTVCKCKAQPTLIYNVTTITLLIF